MILNFNKNFFKTFSFWIGLFVFVPAGWSLIFHNPSMSTLIQDIISLILGGGSIILSFEKATDGK